jgi:hypothetical protein
VQIEAKVSGPTQRAQGRGQTKKRRGFDEGCLINQTSLIRPRENAPELLDQQSAMTVHDNTVGARAQDRGLYMYQNPPNFSILHDFSLSSLNILSLGSLPLSRTLMNVLHCYEVSGAVANGAAAGTRLSLFFFCFFYIPFLKLLYTDFKLN